MHSSSGFLENKQRREYRSGHRMPPLILPLNCRSGPEKSSVGRRLDGGPELAREGCCRVPCVHENRKNPFPLW